jgi:hypothetical protein
MDLLDNVASELGFGYILYLVSDDLFGSKQVFTSGSFRKSGIQHEFNHSQDPMQEQLRDKERNARKFNRRHHEQPQWNGIIGDLVTGSADMSFAPLSVSK